jgi:hypothetical protein
LTGRMPHDYFALRPDRPASRTEKLHTRSFHG